MPTGRGSRPLPRTKSSSRPTGSSTRPEPGPCLPAWTDRTVVRVDDLARDTRWPHWARRAHDLGLRASLSAPLVAGDTRPGALKVNGDRPRAYGSREESLLGMFATQAAVLVANVKSHADANRASARLAASVRGRDTVNRARGRAASRWSRPPKT
ncbi:GAF domain-containing protein [Amycolatopsis sp. NPDC051106]|uniref:GAF domain-containing protein n=1 Tax=unclassified Amycolatopsis TaxID=2618356 RepID=UPI00343726DF